MIDICEEEDKDKDFIWLCEDVGKESFIYFKNMTHKSRPCMVEHIIRESKAKKQDGDLIKAEIQQQIYTNEYYLSIVDIAAMNLIRRY